MARATDSPSEVLPTPGGPTSASTAPERRPPTTPRPRSRAALAHGQVLDDPVLHVVEPGSGPRRGPRARRRRRRLSSVALVPRQVEDGVEPGADPADLGRLLRRPLELVDLRAAPPRGPSRAGRRPRRGRGSRPPASALPASVELGELLADGGELLAQQELPLLLLHALLDVLADRLGHVQLGQVLLGPADDQRQPLDARRRSRADRSFCVVGQVRRVARPVGEQRRVGDAAVIASTTCQAPRCCRIVVTSALYCLAELVGSRVRRRSPRRTRRLDPQRRTGARRAGADLAPGRCRGRPRRAGRRAAGRPARPRRACRRRRTCRRGAGRPAGTACRRRRRLRGVERGAGLGVAELDGDDHSGEHHAIGEGQHGKCSRGVVLGHVLLQMTQVIT